MHRRGTLGAAALALLVAACGGSDSDGGELGEIDGELAHPGPWQIPADTLAIGDGQYVEYTGAGPWPGNCAPGITSGSQIIADYLEANFPQISSIGGYSCRAINGDPTRMSVHGTGRALDIFIPLDGGEADNDLGDPIGNWLIENAEVIGIQYIIWDLWTWNASKSPGSKDKSYGGAHPHDDHLHVEVSVESSVKDMPWFDDQVTPPALENCETIGPVGVIIDEKDGCFQAFGPAMFWRVADGIGYEGSLLWSNAFEASMPSNWARWNFDFEQDGEFKLEVYVEPGFAMFNDVRYEVRHGGGNTVVYIDQSAASGWTEIGDFSFAPGGDQHLAVFDDVPTAIPDGQSFVADAVRLTPTSGGGAGGSGGSASPWPDGGSAASGSAFGGSGGTSGGGAGTNSGGPGNRTRVEEVDSGCGCRAVSQPAPRGAAWGLLLGALALLSRRRAVVVSRRRASQ